MADVVDELSTRLVRLMALPAPCAAQLVGACPSYRHAFVHGVDWAGASWQSAELDTGIECGGWTDISGPAWAEAVLDALEPDAWERVRGEVLERLG